MLVLSRKINEVIHIGDDIQVVVTKIQGDRVRLGIKAPKHMEIRRGELKREALHLGDAEAGSRSDGKDAALQDS